MAVSRGLRHRLSRTGRGPGGPATIDAEDGSVLPLILGFWLVAMVFVAGSIALGTAFTHQRSLQSTCDAAALAAANGLSRDRLHSADAVGKDLPLAGAQAALSAYLARDRARSAVRVDPAQLDPDGVTVRITCHRHTTAAFQTLIGHREGFEQSAHAQAASPID